MVKGRIWGELDGEIYNRDLKECDVIVAFGMNKCDGGKSIAAQIASMGYGLSRAEICSSIARCAVDAVKNLGESPEEKKALVRLFLRKIDEYTKESSPSFEEMMEKLERFLNESGIHEL